MNFTTTTFLFCTIFAIHYIDATGTDDLQKLLANVSITTRQSHTRHIVHTECSHEYDCTTSFYNNGDWEKISFIGDEGIREVYNHAIGRITRTTVSRNQLS